MTHGGATYSHGANGDRASKTVAGATTSYRLDALGNLTGITLADGTVIDYLIDGANRRIGKKRNSALAQGFLYDGALRLIAELNGAGGVVSRFVYATRQNVPDFMVRGGATYRIISDHLGSPRIVVDVSSGTVAQRIDYDEFGRVTADSNPGFQPFGFAGGLLDPDTGLVRFGARDYDAETGRWMAEDPILFAGGDVNLYAYSFDDPVNVQDPLGTQGGQCGGTDKPLKEKKLTDLLPDLKPDPLDDPLSHVPIKEEAEDKSLLEKGKDKSRDFVNDLKNGKRGDPPVTFEPKVKEDQRFEADMKQAGKSTATIPIIPAIPIPF